MLVNVGDRKFLNGYVAYDDVVTKPSLVEKNGKLELDYTKVKETFYGSFWATVDFALASKNLIADTLFMCISDAVGSEEFARRAIIDIERIFDDYRSTVWLGSFHDRDANVRKGQLYGDDIASDPEIGEVIVTSAKNQVGFKVEYAGRLMKIRVTRDGFIQVYGNIDTVQLIELIRDTLWDYVSYPENRY